MIKLPLTTKTLDKSQRRSILASKNNQKTNNKSLKNNSIMIVKRIQISQKGKPSSTHPSIAKEMKNMKHQEKDGKVLMRINEICY